MTRVALLDSHRRGAFPPDALAWHVEIAEWRPIEGAAPAAPAAEAARTAHSAQSGVGERMAFDPPPPASPPATKPSAAQRRAQAQQRLKGGTGNDGGQRLLSASASERQQALAALQAAGTAARTQGGPTAAQRPGARAQSPGTAGAKDAGQSGIAALECLRRFIARGIDTLTLGVVGALIAWHYAARSLDAGPELAQSLLDVPAPVAVWMLAFLVMVPLEALMVASAGTTPGKALLGLRIAASDGGRPSPAASLQRALGVYLRGLALGIPVLAFFTLMIAGARRLNHGRTRWDEGTRLVMVATPLSGGRWQLALVAFIAAWVALSSGLWEQLLYGSGLLH